MVDAVILKDEDVVSIIIPLPDIAVRYLCKHQKQVDSITENLCKLNPDTDSSLC